MVRGADGALVGVAMAGDPASRGTGVVGAEVDLPAGAAESGDGALGRRTAAVDDRAQVAVRSWCRLLTVLNAGADEAPVAPPLGSAIR